MATSSNSRRRGRPTLSTDDPAARDRILEAARAIFANVGYPNSTMQQIAARAGVTRPAINHHFGSKVELYEVVFAEAEERVIRGGVQVEQANLASFLDRIDAFLEVAVAVDATDDTMARFIMTSLVDTSRVPELAHLAARQSATMRAFLIETCELGVTEGSLAPDTDCGSVAEALLAVIWGAGLYGAFLGDHHQLTSVVARIGAILRRGVVARG